VDNVDVDILGQTYSVKGGADPEYTRQIAHYVDEKMRTLAGRGTATVSTSKLAVFAALNIADELFRLRSRQQEMEDLVRRKTGDLFAALEDE